VRRPIRVGRRKSGKTLAAIHWLLHEYPNGIILEPDHMGVKHTIRTISDLTKTHPTKWDKSVMTFDQYVKYHKYGPDPRPVFVDEIQRWADDYFGPNLKGATWSVD